MHNLYDTAERAMLKLAQNLIDFAPSILGAFVLLAIGFVIAWIVGWVLRKASARLGIDRVLDRAGLGASLQEANIHVAPSGVIGKLGFWLIMLTFLLAALDTLGFAAVSEAFAQIIAYIPNLFVAIVILVLGIFIAQATRATVALSLHRLGLDYNRQIASAAYYLIALLALMMATRQLKVDISAFENIVYLLVGAVVLYGGVLLVWGSHATVESIIAGYNLRRLIQPGDRVSVGDVSGEVEVIEQTHVILKGANGRVLIPSRVLLREISQVSKHGVAK